MSRAAPQKQQFMDYEMQQDMQFQEQAVKGLASQVMRKQAKRRGKMS